MNKINTFPLIKNIDELVAEANNFKNTYGRESFNEELVRATIRALMGPVMLDKAISDDAKREICAHVGNIFMGEEIGPVEASNEPKIPSFATKDEAWDFIEELADDGCKDNYRFAWCDDEEAMEAYDKQAESGCCGSIDRYVLIAGRKATIGLNYGH